MKFKICNGRYNDFIIIEGDNLEEIREKAKKETAKRGWQDKDCWSEEVEE